MVAHAPRGARLRLVPPGRRKPQDTPITREELSRHPWRLLSSGRNRTKAEVRVFDVDGQGIVLKDFRSRSFLVRHTIGRFSIARECRAYGRLTALPGIPGFHGRVGPYALAYAFVGGRSLPEHARRSIPGSFFDALEELLARVHERGVAVADLHHRNVIVAGTTGGPILIDFSLAMREPSSWNVPGRWVFERALGLDRLALERMRRRYQAPVGASRGVDLAVPGIGAPAGPGSKAPDRAPVSPGGATGSGSKAPDRAPLSPPGAPSSGSKTPDRAPLSPPGAPGPGLLRLHAWGRSLKRTLRRARGKS